MGETLIWSRLPADLRTAYVRQPLARSDARALAAAGRSMTVPLSDATAARAPMPGSDPPRLAHCSHKTAMDGR